MNKWAANLLCLGTCFGLCLAGRGQTAQPALADQPYTLHTSARVVLTDVVVTDRDGVPVHGLDRTAFRLTDNKKPQVIASFEEHSSSATPVQARKSLAAGVFSNDYLVNPPAVFNAVMLDTSTIGMVDQMWVNQQLERFIRALPQGQMLAIFVHATEMTVLLQDFTADHDLLLRALHKAVPRVPQAGVRYTTEVTSLQQIAAYLSNLPGRKNVIWFSGGSNLFLRADAASLPPGVNLQPVYDQLEQGRIAIYPVDVRGPLVGAAEQQMLMEEQARATGGTAYLNTNELEEAARKIVDDSSDFYTLTYIPSQYKLDNKWHKVKVEVTSGHYNLSYRRGYYDDGSGMKTPTQKSRTRLTANGKTDEVPETRAQPIIFSAELIAGLTDGARSKNVPDDAPKRGDTMYTLHYRVPSSAFAHSLAAEGDKVEIGAGVLVSNSFGRTVVRKNQKFTLTFDHGRLEQNPAGTLSFDQRVDLPKGDDSLFVMVWDPASGRTGTLQVPVTVARK